MIDERNTMKISPVQQIALSFLGIIFAGSFLLMSPVASRTDEWTNFLDALFTATSATCVTGLTTLTMADHWSLFGQIIILLLIEIGGLGFISMFVIAFFITKKKISLQTRLIAKESYNLHGAGSAVKTLQHVITLSLITQLIGVFFLSFSFVQKFGWGKGLWYSIFHAVSAFCNAGFDLFGDSLIGFQNDPYVLTIISFLIISGGLGFIVWADLLDFKFHPKFTLHTKLALTTTGCLLFVGWLFFFLFDHSGGDGNGVHHFFLSFFNAVTPRTAGFFAVDYGKMSYASVFLTILLMFVGGTSGSTAGGLKTTTIAVLVLRVRSILKGEDDTVFLERTISPSVIHQAFAAFFISISTAVLSIYILLMTENVPLNNGLEYIAFEVISALGTVGLTMGLTEHLTTFGKAWIIFLMYIGRIGIFTFIFSIGNSGKQKKNYKYPEETVTIT
jgi:trk system potassium uptake protein TrkH